MRQYDLLISMLHCISSWLFYVVVAIGFIDNVQGSLNISLSLASLNTIMILQMG